MLKKALLVAATLGFSGAALAHPPHWAPAHGYRHHHYYQPYVMAPRPVYVVPAPRVVYAAPPAPVVYPAPVYQAPVPVYPAPIGAPGVSIRLHLPL